MKKVLFICLSLFLISCSKSDNKVWDSNAMVSLRPEVGVKSAQLTAREIVERTTDIMFFSPGYNMVVGRKFAPNQKDFVNNRLLMFGEDVIDRAHGLVPTFIECVDLVFVRFEGEVITDTLAYIPNTTMRAAEAVIKKAYTEQDYNACYEIFDNAWRFVPITGVEWRALKAVGKN